MSARRKSPLEAKKAMMIERRRKMKKEKRMKQKQKLAEEELQRDKKHRLKFKDIQNGDFVQIIDSLDLDNAETKLLASQIFGDFNSLIDTLGVITAKNSKKNCVIVLLLKGDNIESLKDKYSPDEFPSVLLHYSLTQKLDAEASEEMQRFYNDVSVKIDIDEDDLVTLYVVKQGRGFSSKLITRRWSLYCLNDKDADSTSLFHVADCVVTKEQDQKEMESPYVAFVWSEDTLNTTSFQPNRQSTFEQLATISKVLEVTEKEPRTLQALPHVNKIFVGRPRKSIPLFHKGVPMTKREHVRNIVEQCSTRSGGLNMECYANVFQLQPIHSDSDFSDKLFLEDRDTSFDRVYHYMENNRFLMAPVPVRITKRREEEFEKGDRVRIIKDQPKKKAADVDVQYMIGEVTKVMKRSSKCSVLVGSVRYSIPMDALEHIPLEQNLLEVSQKLEAMGDVLFLKNKNEVVYLEEKNRLGLGNAVDYYVLDNNSEKEIFTQFIEDNIDKQSLLSTFYVHPVLPKTIYLDVVTDLLTISDYEPPQLQEHILEQCEALVSNALSTSTTVQRELDYSISYDWPPKVGDAVYIMGGLYRGETGKIICINKGIGISSYGEAVVELDGLYRDDCIDFYLPMEQFPCKKWGSRTVSSYLKSVTKAGSQRSSTSSTSSLKSQSVDSSLSLEAGLVSSEDLGSSASQVGSPSPPKSPIKYYSGSKVHKWLSNFTVAKSFMYKGREYPTVEHAFQAQKIDPSMGRDIVEEYQTQFVVGGKLGTDPKKAKKFGSKAKFKSKKYSLNPTWDDSRVHIMEEILTNYYEDNPEMKEKLIETGGAPLVHRGRGIDNFWGEKKAGGENHHGRILMRLRSRFIRELKSKKARTPSQSKSQSKSSPGSLLVEAVSSGEDKNMKKVLHTVTLTYLLPIIEEVLPFTTKLWKGSLRTYISFNKKESLELTTPEASQTSSTLSSTAPSTVSVQVPSTVSSPVPSTVLSTSSLTSLDDIVESKDTYKPLNMMLKEDQIVRITKGKYENFLALITDKIYIHDKPIKYTTNCEKAWNVGMIDTSQEPSKAFLEKYPNNSVRLGNQYYVRLELYEDLYEEVAEMMGKSEQWLKDFFDTTIDKYGAFPERKKFLYLTVPPLQERTLPEDILLSIYQQQELELISSGKAKQHCTRQLMQSQQKKKTADDLPKVQMPTLTTYVVSEGVRELKRKFDRKEELFGDSILVYKNDSLEHAEVDKTTKPKVFVYDL